MITMELKFLFILFLVLGLGMGCGPQETRVQKYQEVSIKPSAPSMPLLPTTSSAADFSWEAPVSWEEFKGEGMRLATFKSHDTAEIECSIVSLSGAAGGLAANINRWMTQIQLTPLSEEKLSEFLNQQKHLSTQSGEEIVLVDLSLLQSTDPASTQSILGAVVAQSDKTIFIKMTGTKAALINNREQFETLCQSLNLPK